MKPKQKAARARGGRHTRSRAMIYTLASNQDRSTIHRPATPKITTRGAPGQWRWASGKSAVGGLFIFPPLPCSAQAPPISPMDLKSAVVTKHERCFGLEFQVRHDPPPKSDNGQEQEEAP